MTTLHSSQVVNLAAASVPNWSIFSSSVYHVYLFLALPMNRDVAYFPQEAEDDQNDVSETLEARGKFLLTGLRGAKTCERNRGLSQLVSVVVPIAPSL